MGVISAISNLAKDKEKQQKLGNAVSTLTSYQKNLATPAPQETPTTRGMLGRIANVMATDMAQGQSLFEKLRHYQSDPSTPVYNPFLQATNKSIQTLANLGFDVSNIDDKWFDDNAYLMNYYETSNTTNNVKAPTKKSSALNQAAYAYNQLLDARETSNKARQEFDAAMEEASILAQMTDRNYSDDQIVEMVYGNEKKYPTLAKMEKSKLSGEPIELNFAVPYSKDALYGAVWMGRNPDYKGDLNGAMANSYNGVGNVWKEDPVIQEKLENSPYSLGSTMDAMRIYYNQSSFDQKWVNDNRWRLDSKDKTDRDNYIHVAEVVEKTADMKKQAADFQGKVDRLLVGATDPETVMKRVDRLLNSGDYNLLADMDKSVKRGYYTKDLKYIETSEAVNYSRNDVENYVRKVCAENAAKPSGIDYAQNVVSTTSATGANTAPAVSQQEKEIVASKDKTLKAASPIIEGDLTSPEQAVKDYAWSVTFDTVMSVVKQCISLPGARNALAKNQDANINAGINSTLSNFQGIYDYDSMVANVGIWEQEAQKLRTNLGGRQLAEQDVKDRTENVVIGGTSYTLSFSYDPVNGYYLDWADDNDHSIGVDGTEFQTLANSEDVRKLIDKANADADAIHKAKTLGLTMTDKDRESAERLKALELKIADAQEYLSTHHAEYEESKAAFEDARKNTAETYAVMRALGMDTTKYEQADELMAYMTNFSEYESTVWSAYNPSAVYREAIAAGEDVDAVRIAAMKGNEEIVASLEQARLAKRYIEENNLAVPENYKINLNRAIAKMERDIKDYEYFSLSQNDDFDEFVSKGKEIEQREQEEASASISDSQRTKMLVQSGFVWGEESRLEKLAYGYLDYFTEDEKNTYYYLRGKGDDEAAEEYIRSLVDGTYGVMQTRKTEAVQGLASGIVEQGLVGFLAGNALAIVASPFAALASLGYAGYSKATMNEINPDNAALLLNNFRNKTREQSAVEIEDQFGKGTFAQQAVQMFYEMAVNRLDSLANGVAFGGLSTEGGVLNELFGSFPMGFTASMDAMAEAKRKGATDAQAWGIGLVTFFAETGTEAISLENMKEAFRIGRDAPVDTIKKFLRKWLTSSGPSEMLGESANDIIEGLSDELIMGELSDHADRVWQYRMNGYSKEDAEAMARRDEIMNVGRTALMSYLSPGMDVFSTAAGKADYYRRLTRSYQRLGDSRSIFQVARDESAIARAKEEEARNDNHEPAPMDEIGDELEARYGRKASEQEAGTAVPSEAVPDFAMLQNAATADMAAQTATLAAVLDVGTNQETTDMARAAAITIHRVIPGGLDEVKDILLGAEVGGSDVNAVKAGLRYAALGGEHSACHQLVINEGFRTATPDVKADLLSKAAMVDLANPNIVPKVNANVRDCLIAIEERNLIADGAIESAKAAQEKAEQAAENTMVAESQLADRQNEADAAVQNANAAADAVASDSGNTDNLGDLEQSWNKVDGANRAVEDAEANLETRRGEQERAEADAKEKRDAAMETVRETATANVNAAMEQRATENAEAQQQALNAQAQEAENKRQQLIADNRSGKTQEESDRAKLERLAAQRGYTGEQAERFINDVINFARDKRLDKIDMSKQLSVAEGWLMMGALSRRFGVNVVIGDMADGDNGSYSASTNTITLNKNLPAGQILVEFALHELTHSLEKTGSYQQYQDVALSYLYGSEAELNDAIAAKLSEYEDAGHPLVDDQYGTAEEKAKRELVAEFTRLRLNDKDVVQRMVDAGMGGRMRNFLHNVNQFLRNQYKRLTGQAKEDAEVLRRAERLFIRAIQQREKAKQERKVETAPVAAPVTNTNTEATKAPAAKRPLIRASEKVSGETKLTKWADGAIRSFNSTSNQVARDISKAYRLGMPMKEISAEIQNIRNTLIGGDETAAIEAAYALAERMEEVVGLAKESRKASPLATALNDFFGNGTIPISEKDANALISVYGSVTKANAVLRNAGVKARLQLDKNNNATGLRLDDVFRNGAHVTGEGKGFDIATSMNGADWTSWEDVLYELDHQREDFTNTFRDEYTNNGEVGSAELQADIMKNLWNQISGVSDVNVDQEGNWSVQANEAPANQADEVYDWGVDENDVPYSVRNNRLTKAEKDQATFAAKLEREAVPVTTNNNGDALTSEVGEGSFSRTDEDTEYSVTSWTEEEKARVRAQLKDRMVSENDGSMTEEEMDAKIDKWIEDVNSVAAIILADRHRLDYEVTDENKRFLKPNEDYYYTLDASTLCAKRLLFQGTFDTIQRMLPNTPLLPEELIALGNMMREMGYETPCGICYVESRRRWLGKYANEWLTQYDGEYIPTIRELTTSDGLEYLRLNHKEAYDSFTQAMKDKGSANPKVVQLRMDYRGDINDMTPGEVQNVIDIGGLRVQSFSDFEVPHLIDMMQAVLDMASNGLTSQAYTKVPEFAAVFGQTGIKINLSEIGKDKGYVIDGGRSFDEIASMPYAEAKKYIKLLYDDVEGMPHDRAIELRNQNSHNVGTILVGMNDEHIIAAMADGEVDFIIPFHQSGWSEKELNGMPVLKTYSDYTDFQNERVIVGKAKTVKEFNTPKEKSEMQKWIRNQRGHGMTNFDIQENGKGYTVTATGYQIKSFKTEADEKRKELKAIVKRKLKPGEVKTRANFTPVGSNYYWDFKLSGEQNAEKYLEMCKKDGRMPKFWQFLVDDGDGGFSLPQGDDYRSTAIRQGYWKTLIDFKMYDNDGNGAEQQVVTPNVNMDAAKDVLNNYSLSRKMPNGMVVTREDNNTLPVADDVAERFVQWYKDTHPDRVYSTGAGELTDAQKAQALREANIDYESALSRGDMRAAQADVDYAAEQAGYIKAGYHGTLSGGFTIFDKAHAGIGGNSGAGFYFSSNEDDSEANYSEVEGADNYFKASHLVEKLENLLSESEDGTIEYEGYEVNEDMSSDEILSIAKKILTKNPQTYSVYLNPGKAYIRDFNNSTNLLEDAINGFDESLYNVEDYDNEDDYYDDLSMARSDALYEAISNAVYNGIADVDSNYEIYSNVDYEGIIGKLAEIAMDYETLTWNDLIKVLEDEYIDVGTENMDEPTDGSHEIARAIVEAFGFDSIEDREVSKKFNQLKNMGSDGDTVHYIMFRPDQIKLADTVTYDNDGNVIPLEKRFNPTNNDIRYSTGDGAMTAAQKAEALREADIAYQDAVDRGDMEEAQRMVDDKANTYLNGMLLPNDSDEKGFQYHRGPAPTKTFRRYAVLNVAPDGFRAAYAGNKNPTPLGVWLDAQNLESYMSDHTQFADGSFATYIPGDTGVSAKEKFSPELLEEYGLKPSQNMLLERGGKHSSDVPNFSQMNLRQDENGNKVTNAKRDGALPHNKLIFEIEYGISDNGDLTEYVRDNGRIDKNGRNQGLARIQPNQYYDFKTNPNAVGNWGIGGTFRITRLVPYDEVVSKTEEYKKDAVAEAERMYNAGEISKADRDKRISNANAIQLQKWVGGYHPEDFNLTPESVEEMVKEGHNMKLTDAVTYDDNGNVIPLSERFSDRQDIRYSTGDGALTPAQIDNMLGGSTEYSGNVAGYLGGHTGYHARSGYVRFDNAPKQDIIDNLGRIGMQYNSADRTWTRRNANVSLNDIVRAVENGSRGIAISNPRRRNGRRTQPKVSTVSTQSQMEQALIESGIFRPDEFAAPLEGMSPALSTAGGPAQRQFGAGMLQNSDEIAREAKAYVLAQNGRTIDTNANQVDRALQWITNNRESLNSDGLYESIQKITSNNFDYRSADGQARMVSVMGMAIAKGDTMAQVALADAFNRQGTDLGRALQARKLFKMMTPEGRIASLDRMKQNVQDQMNARGVRITDENGNVKDLTFSDWVYRAAAAATTDEDYHKVQLAAANELAEQIPANWKDRLRGVRMLSMLGNPRTHVRNVLGNMLFVPVVSLKNKLGAIGEMITGQDERTKTLTPILPKEIRDFAKQDAIAHRDALTGEAKYNEDSLVERQQKPFKGFLQALMDFNSKKLEDEDWHFLRNHYQRALGGWIQANGYTLGQLQNDPALLDRGREYATQEAQKATYRDFNKLASVLNNISRQGGAAGFMVDAVLPFRKTPANILRRGVEYSPAAFVRSLTTDLYHLKQWNDAQSGKLAAMPEKAISPNEFIDRLCSGLSGTAIMAVGALLSSLGVVTVGLDDDDDRLEKEKGNQEYAVKVSLFGNDVTFTMDWAAPISMPFFVGAAIQEQLSQQSGFNVEELIDAFGNISEPVLNLSMLDGVNSLFKTSQYDDTNTITQIGAKVLSNYVTSYVPSLLGAVARIADDKRRKSFVESGQGTGVVGTFRYAAEQVENKIPGLSQTNIPYRNIWGEEETSSLAERVLENLILPGYVSDYKNDPILNELGRLYDITGDASMIPADPAKSATYKKETYVFTAEQWDRYKEVRGKTAHDLLGSLIETDDYQKATPDTQAQMIKDTWSYADKVGKAEVIPGYEMEDKGKNAAAAIAKDGTVNAYKDEMFKALNSGDYQAYETMVEALEESGMEDSDIKSSIAGKYRDQYKDAYRKGDNEKMIDIEDMLDNSGFDFDYLAWQEQVNEKYGLPNNR